MCTIYKNMTFVTAHPSNLFIVCSPIRNSLHISFAEDIPASELTNVPSPTKQGTLMFCQILEIITNERECI